VAEALSAQRRRNWERCCSCGPDCAAHNCSSNPIWLTGDRRVRIICRPMDKSYSLCGQGLQLTSPSGVAALRGLPASTGRQASADRRPGRASGEEGAPRTGWQGSLRGVRRRGSGRCSAWSRLGRPPECWSGLYLHRARTCATVDLRRIHHPHNRTRSVSTGRSRLGPDHGHWSHGALPIEPRWNTRWRIRTALLPRPSSASAWTMGCCSSRAARTTTPALDSSARCDCGADWRGD